MDGVFTRDEASRVPLHAATAPTDVEPRTIVRAADGVLRVLGFSLSYDVVERTLAIGTHS